MELIYSDANRWPDDLYTVCPSGAQWPYILVLAAPAMIRLIQCLKRYFDSMLKIHLINVGRKLYQIEDEEADLSGWKVRILGASIRHVCMVEDTRYADVT
jgi:hypothetical protein